MMNNLTVSLQSRDSSANEFVVSLDNQRDKLYRRNRFDNLIYQQCAFEMMFRPKESEVNSFETPARGYGAVLNGQSVDGDVMVYVETDRTTDPPTTRLNMLSTNHPEHVSCVSSTSFSFDVGIIREATVDRLKNDPRPPFGTKVSPRPSSKSAKLADQANQKSKTSTPSPTRKPSPTISSESSTPSSSLSSPTSVKPKGAYSPSKSFFSYEMGGMGPTTSSTSPDEKQLMSNEIPVEELKKEQVRDEEELNEIIKELKSDEEEKESEDSDEEEDEKEAKEVGELKTREVNMTSEKGEGSSESSSNATSSDPEAVKSSRTFMNSFTCLVTFSAIFLRKYFT